MKITVITRTGGKIVGAFQGHSSDPVSNSGIRATPVAGLGQKLYEVEVPEDFFPAKGAAPEKMKQFEKQIKALVPKRKKSRARN